jgi:hypothetical protein
MGLRSTHTDENRCGRVIFDGASAASRKPALSEVEGDLHFPQDGYTSASLKNNCRSFDYVWRKSAPNFAQDDSAFLM